MKPSTARVLVLLRRFPGGLTALDCLDNGGGFRLSGRILELRQMGHNIETDWQTGPHGVRYAKYRLIEKPVQMPLGIAS